MGLPLMPWTQPAPPYPSPAQVVIHGDLKPANVLFGTSKVFTSFHKRVMQHETGIVKLTDFGLPRTTRAVLNPEAAAARRRREAA